MTFQSTLLLVTSFAITAFAGCGSYLAPDRHVSRTITELELVGTWSLTTESLGYLTREGYHPEEANHRFELHADGSVIFKSVCDTSEFSYLDGTGIWTIKNGNRLELEIVANDRRYYLEFGIGEKRGRLLLWQFYGDPDMWEFLEYTSSSVL